jgi:membrane-bound lytic murein transglycosylase B
MTLKKITLSTCLISLLSLSACQTTASNSDNPSLNSKASNITSQELVKEQPKSLIKLDNFLIQTSEKHKIPLEQLKEAYKDIKPQASARKLVSPPPTSVKKNWTAHRKLIIDPIRLSAGEKFWKENQTFLEKTERETGVPIEIIVGIIGIETMYGSNMGNFPVQDVLATLAFDYPPAANKEMREVMFTQQLEDLTIYCWEQSGSVSATPPTKFKNCLKQPSSFAGAIGMPQFMPTSIRKFAKDGDGDGTIDIRRSKEDAIASVANFMIAHGWQKGQPVFLEIPNNEKALAAAQSLADGNPDPKHTLSSLKDKGILNQWPKPMQAEHLALIVDLPTNEKNGNSFVEYVVGLKNFEVITLYNRSFFYAKVVTDFGYTVGQRMRTSISKDPSSKENTSSKGTNNAVSKEVKKTSEKKKAKKS